MKKHLLFAAVFFVAFFNYADAQSWNLIGNAGTSPANNFLGTTDNKSLVLRTNNVERMRIGGGGKIGIGTKTPAAYLHLFGTMQIENNSGTVYDEPLLTLRNSAANGTTTNPVIAFKGEDTLFAVMGYDFSTRDMVFSTQVAGITPDLIINHDNGFVGLNTKTPAERLHVLGNQILDGDLTMASTLGKGDINFTTDQQNIAFAAPGTSSSAMIYMSNASTTNRRMVLAKDNSNGTTGLQYEFGTDVFNFMKNASSKLRIDLTNGRVGINDNTPAYPLDVNGYAQIIGNLGVQTTPGTRTIQAGNTQGALIGIGTIEYIQDVNTSTLATNSNWVPSANSTYSLGTSANQWSEVWAIDGTINKSDARDKSNIRDLNYGLKEIMQLHPIKFNWKNNPAEGDKLGVVAQEIQKVLPEVVRDWDYSIDEQTGKKTKVPTDKLGVMYSDIIPVLIRGMQDQQKEIEELKLQIQQLTGNVTGSKQTAASEKSGAGTSMMMQNTPNPFSNNTTISYDLYAGFKSRQIVINDNSGRTIKTIVLNANKGSVVFDASVLPAGTYYYSIMADGKLLETKTMMISK
jgi:hypothetical protein